MNFDIFLGVLYVNSIEFAKKKKIEANKNMRIVSNSMYYTRDVGIYYNGRVHDWNWRQKEFEIGSFFSFLKPHANLCAAVFPPEDPM